MSRPYHAGWPRRALIPAALLVLLLGCPRADLPENGPAAPEPASHGSPQPVDVRPGGFAIATEGDRISLRANGAPLPEVVARLAAECRFDLTGTPPVHAVTLVRERVSLAALLGELLAGVAYDARWRWDESAGVPRHRLVRLVLASPRSTPNPATHAPNEGQDAPPGLRVPAKTADQLAAQLGSADADDRIEAVVEMNTFGGAIAGVVAALDDPDPEVQLAALERLAEDGTFRATEALLGALASEDPAVVVRALQLLESAGDDSLIPTIEPLTRDADPDVREAAEDTLAALGS